MPPACPVESHVGRYRRVTKEPKDATGLSGGDSFTLRDKGLPHALDQDLF